MLMTNHIHADSKKEDYLQTAYLAGGCYWGLEELIRQIPGVLYTKVGFSGGHIKNVSYKEVTKGDTGHAESIEVKFDSRELRYEDLLYNFFKMHDPTTVNQQGNDIGTQYRSVVFYKNDEQKLLAEESKIKVDASSIFTNPVVTEISKLDKFWPAEDYHNNYYNNNKDQAYCRVVIKPKLDKLFT